MIRGFISYAHNDHRALEVMCTYLTPLEKMFGINFWRDRDILAGDRWTSKIADAIDEATVHLLLITPYFIDSNYIVNKELPAINNKYQNVGDLVIPILLERCTWKPFVHSLQVVPMNQNGRLLPIDEWKPKKHGFHAACEQIERSLETFLKVKPGSFFDWSLKP